MMLEFAIWWIALALGTLFWILFTEVVVSLRRPGHLEWLRRHLGEGSSDIGHVEGSLALLFLWPAMLFLWCKTAWNGRTYFEHMVYVRAERERVRNVGQGLIRAKAEEARQEERERKAKERAEHETDIRQRVYALLTEKLERPLDEEDLARIEPVIQMRVKEYFEQCGLNDE